MGKVRKITTQLFFILLSLCFVFVDPRLLDIALMSKQSLLAVVVLLALIMSLLRGDKLILPGKGISYLILLFLVLEVLSLFNSRNLSEGLTIISRDFTLVILILVLLNSGLSREDIIRKFSWPFCLILFLSLLQAVIELYHEFGASGISVESSYNIKSFFAHRNLLSQVLVLSVPVLLFSAKSKVLKILSYVLLAISLPIIIVLFTRSAWLALFLIFLCLIISVFRNSRSLNIKGALVAGTLVTILAIGSVFFIMDKQDLRNQINTFTDWKYGSANKRLEVWEGSRKIIKENPILGYGSGDWKIEINRFIASEKVVDEGNVFYQRPHNDFLWVAADSGVPAMLLYASIFIISLFYFLLSGSSWKLDNPRFIGFLGILAYLVFAMISFPRERTEHMIFLGFYLYLIMPEKEEVGIHKGALFSIAALIIAGLSVSNIYRYKGEMQLKTARVNIENQEWELSIEGIKKSGSFFYEIDALSTPLTYYSAMSHMKLNAFEEARSDLQLAKRSNPYHIMLLNNLGMVYFFLHQSDSAESQFNQVLKLRPNSLESRANLAMMQYNNRNFTDAILTLSEIEIEQIDQLNTELVRRIIKAYIEEIALKEEDALLQNYLYKVSGTPEWMSTIFSKHIQNKISFRKQLYLDVEYTIEQEANEITEDS